MVISHEPRNLIVTLVCEKCIPCPSSPWCPTPHVTWSLEIIWISRKKLFPGDQGSSALVCWKLTCRPRRLLHFAVKMWGGVRKLSNLHSLVKTRYETHLTFSYLENHTFTQRMMGKWTSQVFLIFLGVTHGKTTTTMFDSVRMPATMFKPEAT